MVLFLHNRYRTTGGEERVVEDLMWLVREQLRERAELLARSSSQLGHGRAAIALLRGGLDPEEVAPPSARPGADRARAQPAAVARLARAGGGARRRRSRRAAPAPVPARVRDRRVLHARRRVHALSRAQHAPGSAPELSRQRAEAAAYAASLAIWQRRLVEQADAVVVPSEFARERLRALGAPLPWERVRVIAPPLRELAGPGERPPAPSAVGEAGRYALVASRLAPEKGIEVAIDACRAAAIPLVIAGDGPERAALQARADGGAVTFLGRVHDRELARLRAGAAVALVPSRSAETFGLAAAEAMAAGVPVIASRAGALPELVGEDALVPPGDADALARAIAQRAGDRDAGLRGLERVRAVCSPHVVAGALGELYDDVAAGQL